tara:strand:+ start:141 stop:431 length:291 start_codon:yes stop_codon:yes gene_type:complete
MSFYRKVVIETYRNIQGGSSKSIRARPVAGQGLDTSMNVECSSGMRKSHPLGTKFLLEAKLTDREGGNSFLYAHYNSPYIVLSDSEAAEYIKKYHQ